MFCVASFRISVSNFASIRALPPRTTPDFRDKVKTYLLDAMPFELGMSTLTRTHHFT